VGTDYVLEKLPDVSGPGLLEAGCQGNPFNTPPPPLVLSLALRPLRLPCFSSTALGFRQIWWRRVPLIRSSAAPAAGINVTDKLGGFEQAGWPRLRRSWIVGAVPRPAAGVRAQRVLRLQAEAQGQKVHLVEPSSARSKVSPLLESQGKEAFVLFLDFQL